MAETSDFQGTVKIRAKSEEIVAKIITLNSVAQLNAYYDTQFQDFETTRHLKPRSSIKRYIIEAYIRENPGRC